MEGRFEQQAEGQGAMPRFLKAPYQRSLMDVHFWTASSSHLQLLLQSTHLKFSLCPPGTGISVSPPPDRGRSPRSAWGKPRYRSPEGIKWILPGLREVTFQQIS